MSETVVVKNRRARRLLQTLFALALASTLFACSGERESAEPYESLVDLADIADGEGGFVIEGVRVGHAETAIMTSSAGDVNGDGLDDLLIHASTVSRMHITPPSYRGMACVVFGKTDGATVDYSDIVKGIGGFTISSFVISRKSSSTIKGVGDVNGDGLDDIIVWWGQLDRRRGESFVIFGKADGDPVELSDLAEDDNVGGFRISWLVASDLWDWSVSGAGDVNGDGLDDLLIAEPGAGDTYVIFGKKDGRNVYLTESGWKAQDETSTPVSREASIASGSGGFVIKGIDINGIEERNRPHATVSGAGDVNGDGLDDVIVTRRWCTDAEGIGFTKNGGYYFSSNKRTKNGTAFQIGSTGQTCVVFGKKSGTPVALSDIEKDDDTGGFIINEIENDDSWDIRHVREAGDVNGDGLDDLIVSSPYIDGQRSKAYVVYGKTNGKAVELSGVTNGEGGFIINDTDNRFRRRFIVSSAGDVNGDGLDDVFVSASGSDRRRKTKNVYACVVFGKTNGGAVELSSIARGKGGFLIKGSDKRFEGAYMSVSRAGDVNGDGRNDIIVGVAGRWVDGSRDLIDTGECYLVFGKTGGTPVELSGIASGKGGFRIDGLKGGYELSKEYVTTASVRDVNGDGLDDIIVEVDYFDDPGAKKSYVIFGPAARPNPLENAK